MPLLIGGEFIQSKTNRFINVVNPSTQEVTSRVPEASPAELQAAVRAAREAFVVWRSTPVTQRQRIMFRFLSLLHENSDDIAMEITERRFTI